MKPLNCCTKCEEYDQDENRFNNKLRCMLCEDYQKEYYMNLYNEQKVKKGCSTCAYCKHVYNYPGFVTAEECICEAGLECDTVYFSIENCLKWVGKFENSSSR